jgi:hypothetical protein
MLGKLQRAAIVLVGLMIVFPAKSEELKASDARRFIAGKHFAYTCFEGTSGHGRIYADGSVAGYIQIGGTGPRRYIVLPAGTLRIHGDQYCASLRGIPFEPCFNVDRTSHHSFRGSVSGLGFAYCNFTRRSARADLHNAPLRLRRIREAAVGAN